MLCISISVYVIYLYILVLSPQDVEPPKPYKDYGDSNIDMSFNYNNDYYAIENQPNYPINQFPNQGRVWTIQTLFALNKCVEQCITFNPIYV